MLELLYLELKQRLTILKTRFNEGDIPAVLFVGLCFALFVFVIVGFIVYSYTIHPVLALMFIIPALFVSAGLIITRKRSEDE